jgi:hypothetical protein
MPIVTKEIFDKGKSDNGGWNYDQIRLFNETTPLLKGWKERIIGSEFSDEVISKFLALKNKHFPIQNLPIKELKFTNVQELDGITLTKEIFELGKSDKGGWNTAQIEALGVNKVKGWAKAVIGRKYCQKDIKLFLKLKNNHLKNKEAFKSDSHLFRDTPDYNADYPTNEQYKNPKWITLRSKILERDSFRCLLCGDTQNLHVHHLKYRKNRFVWEIDSKYLVTLCKECHEEWHQKEFD